jgi:hypothetical protein
LQIQLGFVSWLFRKFLSLSHFLGGPVLKKHPIFHGGAGEAMLIDGKTSHDHVKRAFGIQAATNRYEVGNCGRPAFGRVSIFRVRASRSS